MRLLYGIFKWHLQVIMASPSILRQVGSRDTVLFFSRPSFYISDNTFLKRDNEASKNENQSVSCRNSGFQLEEEECLRMCR